LGQYWELKCACKASIIMASAVDTCVYTCSKHVVNEKKKIALWLYATSQFYAFLIGVNWSHSLDKRVGLSLH
jgi:hypothetical protein